MPRKKVKKRKVATGLVEIRQQKGLQSKLARHLGVTRQAISDWPVVPIDRLRDVEKFTGIPREKLRPDIFR
jgi:DNA-binding transcriptional regulator YdaS (Cro superfamily)